MERTLSGLVDIFKKKKLKSLIVPTSVSILKNTPYRKTFVTLARLLIPIVVSAVDATVFHNSIYI